MRGKEQELKEISRTRLIFQGYHTWKKASIEEFPRPGLNFPGWHAGKKARIEEIPRPKLYLSDIGARPPSFLVTIHGSPLNNFHFSVFSHGKPHLFLLEYEQNTQKRGADLAFSLCQKDRHVARF